MAGKAAVKINEMVTWNVINFANVWLSHPVLSMGATKK